MMESRLPDTPSPVPSVTERLESLLQRTIDRRDRECAALHLVDWLGCALAGRQTATGRVLSGAGLDELGSTGGSTHAAAGLAFALGGLGSILEMDDVDRQGLLHPGPVVFSAALAAAGEASGTAFLDAAIRGYEAMVRLGRAVGPGHYAFFHNTATCGPLGAAVAAGHVAGLGREALVWAMGNATSATGGLWQCRHEQVMTKPMHCSEAARRGVTAALLARDGLTGPRFILEGPQGMFKAMCPGADPDAVLDGGDAAWMIHDTSFKPWPACRHAHAAIDAALAFGGAVAPHDIEAIEIETYADAVTFCDRPEPRTENEAKFSLQHSVAVALVDGPPAMEAFAPDALARPEIAALRLRATVAASERYSHAYPRHFGCGVTLVTRDGKRHVRAVADALGDSENPMSRDMILAKYRKLADHAGTDAAAAGRLIDAAFDLLDDAPVQRLRKALLDAVQSS